jgi:hypothetical protein
MVRAGAAGVSNHEARDDSHPMLSFGMIREGSGRAR